MALRAAQADYRAQLTLKAQAYAAYKAGEARSTYLNAAYQRQNATLRQLQGSLSAAGITVQNMASAEARLRERIAETTAQNIMQPLVDSTQTSMTFEAEVSRSRALTQTDHINAWNVKAIESEMAMLDARYKEIGRTTKFTATQAAA